MRAKNYLAAVTLSLLVANLSDAHDIWLLPERFVLSKGDTLVVHQLVGSELEVEMEVELLWRMTPRFDLTTAQGSVDLLRELPDKRTLPVVKPVLKRKLDFEGVALLTMEHAFIWEEWSREQFLENLKHEELGMDRFRDHVGDRPKQTERYARTLKCLLQVGDGTDGDLHKRVVGQKLEILLLQNPYLLKPGDDLEVQVLFDGKPLGGQRVTAFNGDGERRVSAPRVRTSANGVARFNLNREGFWLVRVVHFIPCAERSDIDCSEVDWESYWTSYTFHLD